MEEQAGVSEKSRGERRNDREQQRVYDGTWGEKEPSSGEERERERWRDENGGTSIRGKEH